MRELGWGVVAGRFRGSGPEALLPKLAFDEEVMSGVVAPDGVGVLCRGRSATAFVVEHGAAVDFRGNADGRANDFRAPSEISTTSLGLGPRIISSPDCRSPGAFLSSFTRSA